MTTQFRTLVAKGAAHLDIEMPGWYRKIHVDELNLGSTRYCVLGQAFGDFYQGLNELELDRPSWKYGFDLPPTASRGTGQDWSDLTELWVELISARQAADVKLKDELRAEFTSALAKV